MAGGQLNLMRVTLTVDIGGLGKLLVLNNREKVMSGVNHLCF